MKLLPRFRIITAIVLFAGFGQQALATPIVLLDSPRVAREIIKLDVLGTLYNVTFNNVGDGTFVGNAAGATAARDAINAALNMTTADLVSILNTGVSVNNFGVQDGASTVRGVSFFVPGNWQASGNTALLAPIAQFTAYVPEPGTSLLMVLGLAGLASRRRRPSAA